MVSINIFVVVVVQLVETLRYKLEGRGSISDGALKIFYLLNHFGRTVTLGSTRL